MTEFLLITGWGLALVFAVIAWRLWKDSREISQFEFMQRAGDMYQDDY